MRIDRLDLIAYGPFTDRTIDLSRGSYGLHVIYGDNETGKSTSLRALTAWLFGIPARTDDNFIHPHPKLRIGGKIGISDGRKLEFIRRKGTKDTILKAGAETPLDDTLLSEFLPAEMDASLFLKLYGIDHARLVGGGREILAQSGDLGQALFSAAMGTSGLRGVLTELKDGADELFKPRASTKRVNRAVEQFRAAQKRIRETSLSVSDWKQLQSDHTDILAAIDGVEEKIREKSRIRSRLARLVRVRGALGERRAVLAQIADLGEVLRLPEDFEQRRRSAEDRMRSAAEAIERYASKLAGLRRESQSLNISGKILDNGEAIQAVYKELGAVEKIIQDRPKMDGERRLIHAEAEILLKTVRADIRPEDADRLRPLLNNKKWIADLARKHDLLSQRQGDAQSTLRDVEEERKSLVGQLESIPPPDVEIGELRAAIDEAGKAGDLQQRLLDARKRAKEMRDECREALARLGRFSGTCDMLLKMALPVPETLDAFEKRFDEIAEKIRETHKLRKELLDGKRQATGDLEMLLEMSDIPGLEELEEVRSVRDAGWDLIRSKYIEKEDVEREIVEFSGEMDLPAYFEQKLRDADLLSDRLRIGAVESAKRAELEEKIVLLERHIGDIDGEIPRWITEESTCRNEWIGIWDPLGIDPGTPREMKQWILRTEKLLADIRSSNAAAAEEETLQKEYDALKEALTHFVSRFEKSGESDSWDLDNMIRICEGKADQEEIALERKGRLKYLLQEADARWERVCDELRSIENDRSVWSQNWKQAVEGLDQASCLHPERAMEAFEKLEKFFEKKDLFGELENRISGMDRNVEDFQQRIFALADRIGFELKGMDAVSAAARMNQELTEMREARVSLDNMRVQIRELEKEIESAEITLRTADEEFEELRNLAFVEANEDLKLAGERSGNKRELQKQLENLERELSRNGDGLSVGELEKEAESIDMNVVEGDMEKLSLELEEMQKERDELRDRRQTLSNEIEVKDGRSVAAAALEDSEQQLAEIVSGVEQYLRLQISALILEQRIEAYRKKNQASVLAEASKLFSRLTLGSFAGLRDEIGDDGKTVLMGVRPKNEEVPVEGMSDGTRDQLYLALRLAVLQQHLDGGEPVPFVVDDILVGFDDNRTAVCLEILAELADKTQVLLFTHHRRVVELAAALEMSAGVFVHELACERTVP